MGRLVEAQGAALESIGVRVTFEKVHGTARVVDAKHAAGHMRTTDVATSMSKD